MPELEDRLRALGSDVPWPPAPDISETVVARVSREPGRSARRARRPVIAVALALLLVPAAAMAIPPVRDDILDWLGIGGVEVRRSAEPPPARFPDLADLGPRVPLAPGAPTVTALGSPDEVRAAGGVMTQIYRGRPRVLLAVVRGDLDATLVRKSVDPAAEVREVRVRGARGVFLPDPRHTVFYTAPDGSVQPVRPRLAGPTLVWSRDGTVLRLEADLPPARALALARSVR